MSADDLELRREIGILPEDDALFQDLTMWEHLELCGRLYGLGRPQTDARATQLLLRSDSQITALAIALIVLLTISAYYGSLQYPGRRFERRIEIISRRLA